MRLLLSISFLLATTFGYAQQTQQTMYERYTATEVNTYVKKFAEHPASKVVDEYLKTLNGTSLSFDEWQGTSNSVLEQPNMEVERKLESSDLLQKYLISTGSINTKGEPVRTYHLIGETTSSYNSDGTFIYIQGTDKMLDYSTEAVPFRMGTIPFK